MTDRSTRRAIVAAFLANLGIAAAKFAAFVVTGSAALLAEAIHSVADTGNQVLLFLGGRRARMRPTAEHPFGFGAERYFWAFIVSLVLFTLGSLFALVEGVEKLFNPHEIDSPAVAYSVLAVAVVLEALSLRTARRESLASRGKRSWWTFIHTTKNPELPVVLLEDTGALVGLFFALTGITLAVVTGDDRWDAAGSIAIGLLLGVIAIVLATEMKSLLIGEAAAPETQRRVEHAILDGPEATRVIHLRTLQLGPDDVLVATKLEFATTTVPELARAIDRVEARVRASVPDVGLMFVEPDLYRPDHAGTTLTGDGARAGSASAAATRSAVERFNEAFNRHDVDAVMATMTDDCVFEDTSPPRGKRYEGRTAVRGAWEAFFAASPDAHFDSEDVIVVGDRCVVRWHYAWVADNGSRDEVRGVDVLRVRDGRVAEKLSYVKG